MKPPPYSPRLANFSRMALVALLSASLFLIGPGRASAQSKDSASLSFLESVTIRLVDPDSLPAARPENMFRHFEVIDQRPDTARIGIHTGIASRHSPNKQLSFGQPAKEEIAAYLNTHFARPGAPYTALVVIRTLWLSDANYFREDLMQDRAKRGEKTHIRFKAEIYASKEEGYMPIYRFDSAHISKRNIYSLWGQDLAGMLADFADSASLLTARKAGKGRTLSREEIQQFNQSRFSAPVTTDTAFIRGVYASFDEFRNNNPSIRDFELKQENDHFLLYVKDQGGTAYYSHDAWGYCDGKGIFIMKEGALRRAWKEGKAFYFLSPVDKFTEARNPPPGMMPDTVTNIAPTGGIVQLPAKPAPGAIMTARVSNGGLRIFTVDMDSGDVY